MPEYLSAISGFVDFWYTTQGVKIIVCGKMAQIQLVPVMIRMVKLGFDENRFDKSIQIIACLTKRLLRDLKSRRDETCFNGGSS